MGVGRSSSLRSTADRSPLHDVRQPAPRDRRSTRYKFKFMDELCCWLAEPKLAAPARFRPSGSSAGALSPFGLQRGSLLSLRERRLVEPDGIEPTTSCLQSRRSPN